MTTLASASTERPVATRIGRVLRWLDGVPYTILAIPLRLAVAPVFWNSAMTKLANWNTAIELTTPVLLVLGLATRAAALVLLGMTAVIEVFVYPLAWPTHIQWAAMLLVLLCRGAGNFSFDHLARRRFGV